MALSNSGVGLEIDVFGEQLVSRRLLRFAHTAEDMRPAFREIAPLLQMAWNEQFATEGAYGGERWAPLAESTLRSKPSGLPILVLTGKLKGSAHVKALLPQMLEWGSDVSYGRYHMTGTRNMPARPPIRLPERTKAQVVRHIQRLLVGELRGGAVA
jgi:phage gpG-like protein